MESLKDASGRVQDCLARPALWDLRAEAARDPTARATFAEAAQCWREWRGAGAISHDGRGYRAVRSGCLIGYSQTASNMAAPNGQRRSQRN